MNKSGIGKNFGDYMKGLKKENDSFDEIEVHCHVIQYLQHAPVPFIAADFSEVKQFLDNLIKKGKKDLGTHFKKYPQDVISLADKVKIRAVNNATLKLFHASNDQELRDSMNMIFSKESYDMFKAELLSLFEGKNEFTMETVIETLTGMEKHVLLSAAVMPGYESTLNRVIINLTDITETKRNIDELKVAEEKYRKVFENAHHAIFLVDADSGITLEANRKAENLLGTSVDNIVGMHFSQLYPKEEAEYFRKLFKNKEGGAVLQENTVFSLEDGRRIPVAVSGKTIELRDKKVFSWIMREIKREDVQKKFTILNDQAAVLTQREREVFSFIANGYTNKQIANRLFISQKTVETHRSNIMEKLDIHRESDLVRRAISMGVVNPTSPNQN